MTLRRWAAFAVLAAAACSESPSGLASLRDTGLSISSGVSRTSIDSGQRVDLSVTLTNTSDHPVTLHFNSGCHVLPYVTTLTGTVVAPGGGGWLCTAALTQLTFGPGESKTFTWAWAGGSDFAGGLAQAGSEPKGDYSFYASMTAAEGTYDTPRFLIHLQ